MGRYTVSATLRFARLVSMVITLVVGSSLFVVVPAVSAVADEGPWSGTVSLSVDRAQVDVHDPFAMLTATVSPKLDGPYWLSIYDDAGALVASCQNDAYGFCGSAATTLTRRVFADTNVTRTFTAYVALDAPEGSVPSDDLRATSNTVGTHNTGWSGTVLLSVDRTQVDVHDPFATLTATVSPKLDGPYWLSIYDEAGVLIASCQNDYYGLCGSAAMTLTRRVYADTNVTRTFTAYVAQDAPEGSLPTDDVRAISNTSSATNTGWSGTVLLSVDRTQVDVHDPFATLTATVSPKLDGPYWLSIYDEAGVLIASCQNDAYGLCGSAATTLTRRVYADTNVTRTFTAYVAQDAPEGSLPTDDVRAISNTSSATNTGWSGTVLLSVDRTQVDVHDPFATLTATVSPKLDGPYWLSIYDEAGVLIASCQNDAYGLCGSAATTLTRRVYADTNVTRTFTAYVAQHAPDGSVPSDDLRATSNTISVRNFGWNGSVTLTRGWNEASGQTQLTAIASAKLDGPYWLSIYDDLGTLIASCTNDYYGPCGTAATTLTQNLQIAANRTFTAYVAQDVPNASIPTNDVRAISGRLSTAGNGPTAAGETTGGSNPSVSCSQRCHGDPVNSVTGEFWESATDLGAGNASPALVFTRSFATSRNSVDGPMGFGWTSNFDMTMTVPVGVTGPLGSALQAQVRQENGSVLVFTRTGNGQFAAPARVKATLEQRPDGTFVFTREHRQVFAFDATGRLASLQDLNANSVTLTYTDGHVTRAADGRGASLDFVWSGSRVISVTDQAGRVVTYTYSGAGDLSGVVAADDSTKAYVYDSAHRVVSMTNASGGVTTNAYDTASRVINQTDPLGRVTSFAYTPDQTTITDPDGAVTIERYLDGQVLSETKAYGTTVEATTFFTYGPTNQVESTTDPLGRVTRFSYDAVGNRTSVTDPLGRVSTATYDALNNATSTTNPAGETTTMGYDARGNLVSSTAADGGVTAFTVNPEGTIATATDPAGRVTSFTYDARGFTSSVTGPDGAQALTVYDTAGNKVSATDPRGTAPGAVGAQFTSAFTYDAVGRQLTGTDALGGLVAAVYDAAGQPTTLTDAAGGITTSQFDLAGQLVAVSDAAGAVTSMTYDGAGRVLSVTDAAGSTTSSAYDVLGRTTSVTDALGRVSRTEYDAGNRVTATARPSGARTTYGYDAADQVLTVTDALGNATTTTYDLAGRATSVTDADGRAATSTFDQAGRPVRVVRADGSALVWEYNAAGQVTTYVDAAGATTAYTYDGAGRRAMSTDTAGRVTVYGYDRAGNLTTLTQPGGAVTTYTYDAVGRASGTDYSDATADIATVFDVAGRVTSVTDATGTTGYTYDVLGRVLQVTHGSTSVGYAWDDVNQLTDLTYPSGDMVHRTYDAAGQLTAVTDWTNGTYTFGYDPDGATAQVTYPNGVVTAYDRDASGQTLGITATSSAGEDLLDLAYSYTDSGLMAQQSTTRSTGSRAPPITPTTTSAFTWDALARISQVTGDDAGTFAFDAAGSVTTLAGGRTLAYDAARQLTTATTPATGDTAAVTATFAYDVRGNRAATTTDGGVAAGTITHTYNQANQLATVTGADGGVTAYTYGATGLRATATTTTGGQSTTEEFTWDTQAGIPELLTDATHAYIYGARSTPLAQISLTNGAVDYLHTDALGSVRTTTNATGTVTSDADYDTYGQPQTVTADPIAEITRFGYAGEYTDPTGYIYLRARYYDPATAQFLTIDALVDTTRNPYGYTGGNPLQYADPLGLDWIQDAGDWSAAFGDTLTFGITKRIRIRMGTDDTINTCSTFYTWGGHGGTIASLAPMGPGLVAAGQRVISAGKIASAAKAANTGTRLARDAAVTPLAPRALGLTRSVGRASHNNALQADIAALPRGATDIRVNQQQVNALGQRVGINRPDLQYSLSGQRHYIEYEGLANPRGAAHEARLLANDPGSNFMLRLVP
ncbi:RHS repeat-associated core domain-containing protein [Pengzhenrongella phosphoraccumulans]|uniref:RHS repeat-associated core domain-containing protein n=1 Tax=Pengzhenrongella phosphoraccumulans TaxID=3114394 RepID=UPI00388F7A6D